MSRAPVIQSFRSAVLVFSSCGLLACGHSGDSQNATDAKGRTLAAPNGGLNKTSSPDAAWMAGASSRLAAAHQDVADWKEVVWQNPNASGEPLLIEAKNRRNALIDQLVAFDDGLHDVSAWAESRVGRRGSIAAARADLAALRDELNPAILAYDRNVSNQNECDRAAFNPNDGQPKKIPLLAARPLAADDPIADPEGVVDAGVPYLRSQRDLLKSNLNALAQRGADRAHQTNLVEAAFQNICARDQMLWFSYFHDVQNAIETVDGNLYQLGRRE